MVSIPIIRELTTEIEFSSAIQVIARGISEQDYDEYYAALFCEWVNGDVLKMPPIMEYHYLLSDYLADLLKAYFALKPIGIIREDPFTMRLPNNRRRQPDIQIILKTNPAKIEPSYLDGPADICIEILSSGTEDEDRGVKFREYEAGGVREYWMLDYRRKAAAFYRLTEQDGENIYILHTADENQQYVTPLLPELVLDVAIFWQEPKPGYYDIGDAVRAMLNKSDDSED